jgi:hypothetical protein
MEKNRVEAFLRDKPWFVHACYNIITTSLFDHFMIAVIVGNTVTLSLDHYGISDSMMDNLAVANVVFTALFATEMALKVFGELAVVQHKTMLLVTCF